MSFTLPFDPFLLLKPASVHKSDREFELWNGGGKAEEVLLTNFEPDLPKEIPVTRSTQSLYFELDDIPTKFAFKPYDINYGADNSCFANLPDNGLRYAWYCQDDSDGSGGANYFETLAIADRGDVSQLPISLVNRRVSESENDYSYYYNGPFYEPFVIYYEQYSEIPSWAGDANWNNDAAVQNVFEKTREYITDENNDYYEGVFQYDINNDGDIPDYVPAEYPLFQEDLTSINGKTKFGTKNNDTINGKKKNDLLDGKKGNDILTGKKGDDLLYGKKGFDQLYGSDGDDFLSGGDNDDLLEGGSGSDVFKLSAGNDKVTDFSINQGDQIAIPIDYSNSFTVTQSGDSVIIAASDFGQLELLETDIDKIAEANATTFLRYV